MATRSPEVSVIELLIQYGLPPYQARVLVEPVIHWFDGLSVEMAKAILPNLVERIRTDWAG